MRKIAFILALSFMTTIGIHAVSGATTPPAAPAGPVPAARNITQPTIKIAPPPLPPRGTGNLKAAQVLLNQALQHLATANRNGEFDIHGHAQNADTLAHQAGTELQQSISTAP